MEEKDTKTKKEETQETKKTNENKVEKELAETIINLQKQIEEEHKKREEADARAVELVKALRNSGVQKSTEEAKRPTCKELVKKLFD